jgi:tetratricopeptide (TPR) repeat protein
MRSSTVLLLCLSLVAVTASSATSPQERYDSAKKKLAAATTAPERFHALDRAAKESFNIGKFDEASKYATELLSSAPNYSTDWNYGNAIQDGNLVLGRLALRDGKKDEAKKYLLEAGKSPGSPTMNSFGPNMSLAKDLLEKGEQAVVLEYFELCRSFWQDGNSKLNRWRDEVKKGKIPRFGANLVY